MQSHHFVLVHGMGQGAWCWHKLKPRLESTGHRVTALDMAASGINLKPMEELRTFADYNEPLISFMASLPAGEKLVLVGHSLGGMNMAFAMDEYPEKVSAGVFLAAFVPDVVRRPSYLLEEIFSKKATEGGWLDCQFSTCGSPDEPFTVATLGREFLSLCYSLSPVEDLELELLLARPMIDFTRDLAKVPKLSDERYGSVRRVFVICKEDKALPLELQWNMIECGQVKEVREIEGADHMAMLSEPQELCDCLIEIAGN